MTKYEGEERREAVTVSLSPKDIDALVTRIAESSAKATAQALHDALNEDTALRFWVAGIKALQEHAAEHTGRWILGGVWSIVQRLMLFVLLGGIVYAIGGWTALAKVWDVIFGGGTQ